MDTQSILLIDDDQNISHLIRLYLEKEGYQVYESSRGDEGIAAFQATGPLAGTAGYYAAGHRRAGCAA